MPEAKRVMDFEEIAAHFGYSLGIGAIPVKRFPVAQKRRDGRKVRKDVVLPREDFRISSRHYQTPDRENCRKTGGADSQLSHAAFAQTGPLQRAQRRPFRARGRSLHALHFAHPPLSGPGRPSHPERIISIRKSALLDSRTLHEIGDDTSFTERRAAEAERELIEWKKVKFMEDRVGEEFDALIISTTKFGFFVELTDLFVEGLVPVETLSGDHYRYHENGRKIIGERTRKTYSIGDQVRVRLDRADSVDRKLQFAVVAEERARKKTKKR